MLKFQRPSINRARACERFKVSEGRSSVFQSVIQLIRQCLWNKPGYTGSVDNRLIHLRILLLLRLRPCVLLSVHLVLLCFTILPGIYQFVFYLYLWGISMTYNMPTFFVFLTYNLGIFLRFRFSLPLYPELWVISINLPCPNCFIYRTKVISRLSLK